MTFRRSREKFPPPLLRPFLFQRNENFTWYAVCAPPELSTVFGLKLDLQTFLNIDANRSPIYYKHIAKIDCN
jgi:hypothetical protein